MLSKVVGKKREMLTYGTQAKWMKWENIEWFKFKRKFYWIIIRYILLYGAECWMVKKLTENLLSYRWECYDGWLL